eukprot:362997-Chlamydomonas_euryale.AAC.2
MRGHPRSHTFEGRRVAIGTQQPARLAVSERAAPGDFSREARECARRCLSRPRMPTSPGGCSSQYTHEFKARRRDFGGWL